MKIWGFVLFFSGIGLVIGNYDDKKRFMQKDYTEKDTGIAHYWMYYINDVEPTSGKANANAIADGDVITYTYVAFDPATAK